VADKIYFGVPGAIEEIRAPESGMGFNNNRDSTETQLVSGGRSVYRAPVSFKSFNLSWKSNSAGLRHLIDLYNGQFGPGPFYLTDPTASAENVLPARWANTWQLAHQANGWCKPVVQNATPTTSPAPQLPRTNRIVVFKQALSGSSVPTAGVLKTRTIRVPGKPYYFSAYGSRTGSAAIIIRGFNNSTQTWQTLSTFTDLTGNTTEIIAASNTTYTMIELDISMPLASTLTLYGMCLGMMDHMALQNIIATNYSRNPWAVGTITGFAAYSPGTSETGAYTYVSNATDGPPVYGLSSYVRWTPATVKTGGSTGFLAGVSGNRGFTSGVAGNKATVGLWVRFTGTGTYGGRMRCSFYNAAGATVNSNDFPTTVTLPSGEWVLVTATGTATGDFASVGFWFYHTSAYVIPVGGTLDATGAYIGPGTELPEAFSGATPDDPMANKWYRWTGTVNSSPSVLMDREPTDFMPTGRGVGALQFTNTLDGTLTSQVVDRIGMSVDLTEVQNVESRTF